MKHCTVCNSTNVRRSGAHPLEASQHRFHSPYRCLDCEARFWVVSRRARLGATAGGAVALALVLAVAIPTVTRVAGMVGHSSASAANASTADVAVEPGTQRVVDELLRTQSDYLTRQSQPLPPLQTTSR